MGCLAARARTPARTAAWLASLCVMATVVWLVPSPAAPPHAMWLWGTGLLVLACAAINAWAVVAAVRGTATLQGRAWISRRSSRP